LVAPGALTTSPPEPGKVAATPVSAVRAPAALLAGPAES
jgi:hypothetical protein